jgi:arylsulfatase A-like enzyme
MKLAKWAAAALMLVAAAAGLAFYLNPIGAILLYARWQKPTVAPNHAIAWMPGPATATLPPDERKPNVLVILADDLGYNDITLHGGGVANGAVPTPNIDSIAKQGVELTNGYAGDATCAPSRAAIMTGRYATRFGFEFTPAPVGFSRLIARIGKQSDPLHPPIFHDDAVENIPALDKEAIPASEITVADLLRGQGYHTLHFGKWHLGGIAGSRPENKGFDESLGFIPGASMYLPQNDPGVENSRQPWDPIDMFLWAALPWGVQYNGSPWFAPAKYMTDYLTDEAVAAIHANRNRPFFLYFAPNAPHTPLQATSQDYAALAAIPDHRLRVYGGMVRNLDRNIGRLLQALKDEGLAQNTLVIFTSDNGGAHYIGLPDINRPFRGWKATFFEGGMHVPYFMRWPAHLPAGTKFTPPAAHVDIYATAAAAAGAPLPTDRKLDGVNLVPYLTGAKTGNPHENLFWRSGDDLVVLQDGWKLQRAKLPDKQWLFNLQLDPTEQHNLAASEPAKLQALDTLMDSIDSEQAKPIWPSVLSGAIAIDHPGNAPIRPGDEYVYWDN